MLTLKDTNTGQTVCIENEGTTLPVGFLHENGSYRFEFESDANCDITLLISDEELPPSLREITPEKTRFRWDWYIEEYAGEATISLLNGQNAVSEVALDIAPNPYKLGSEIYRELLLDLQEKAEGLLFGTTPAQALLQYQEADVPPLARFALLRAYLPSLERAFHTIEQAPHRSLIAEREELPLHKVRRVDTRSLRTALKRMPVLAALKERKNPGLGEVATLDVPRRVHTFDTSPNRHTLALLLRLSALCADLLARFESISASDEQEPEYRRRAVRWSELTQRFQERLIRLRRAMFLADVKPAKPDAAALLTISRHPAYSHFDRIARRILSPRVALGGDADKLLCLRNTYDIYEYWCFFTVVEAVKLALPEAEWKSNIAIEPGTLLLNLKNGSSLEGSFADRQVSVIFQQGYNKSLDHDGLFSISKSCFPDIVLRLRRGGTTKTIIFDAKYRSSSESIHAALTEVHCYRDAIRTDADESGIDAAFILTPSHHADRGRYYTDEYRQTFRFGGFDLLPHDASQMDALVEYCRNALQESVCTLAHSE